MGETTEKGRAANCHPCRLGVPSIHLGDSFEQLLYSDPQAVCFNLERVFRLFKGCRHVNGCHVHQADIVRKLKDGHSVRNTAKITGKDGSTVQRVNAILKENGNLKAA